MGEISQSGIKSRQKSCWDWPSRLKNFRDKWGKVQKSWIDPDFSQKFSQLFLFPVFSAKNAEKSWRKSRLTLIIDLDNRDQMTIPIPKIFSCGNLTTIKMCRPRRRCRREPGRISGWRRWRRERRSTFGRRRATRGRWTRRRRWSWPGPRDRSLSIRLRFDFRNQLTTEWKDWKKDFSISFATHS